MELLNVGINARTPEPGSATKKQHRPVADRQPPAYPMNFPPDAVEKNRNYGNYTKIPATVTVDGSKPVAEVGDKDAKQEFYPFKPVEPEATQTLVSGSVKQFAGAMLSNGSGITIAFTLDVPQAKVEVSVLDSFNQIILKKFIEVPEFQTRTILECPCVIGQTYTVAIRFEAQTKPYTWQVQ